MLKNLFVISLFLFGLSLSGTAQITPKKLIKEYQKAMKPYDDWNEETNLAFIVKADMKIGQFELPVKFFVKRELVRVEMEMMGVAYFSVLTDTLTWATDLETGGYTFEDSESSDALGFEMDKDKQFEDFLESGYQAVEVKEVMLDSIEAYQMLIRKEEDEKTFYFDRSDYVIIGRKWAGEEVYFLAHEKVLGFLWPKTYIVKDAEDGFEMTFNEYDFDSQIPDELFQFTSNEEAAYRKFLNTPVQESVNYVQLYYDQGDSLREARQYAAAIEAYNKSIEISPNQYHVLNARGLAKTFSGDHYGAITDIARALELRGVDDAVLLNNLGLSKYRLGDYKGAKVDYERAISLDTTNANFYSNYGLLMFQSEDYEAVVENFTKSLALKPDNVQGYYYRAIALAELKYYEDALNDYAIVEAMGVEIGEFYNYKGVSFYQLQQFDSAQVAFSNAVKLDPEDEQYWKNLADAHDELEQYHEAIAIYDQLISKDSTSADTFAERALSYYYLSLNVAAKRDIDKAIELSPESAGYYDYRAYILEEQGNYTGAVEDFTMSLNLQQDPYIYYRRGLAKINLSNKSDACADFKKGAELESEEARSAMAEHCKL